MGIFHSDMTVPGELICEMAQIHKRQAEDISPFGFHPVGLRSDIEDCVCLPGLSYRAIN